MAVQTLSPPAGPEALLVDAVDGLLAVRAVELAPGHALERLGTVLSQSERLTAVALDGVADLETRELFVLDDTASAAGWLRARRVGGDPRLLALARRLVDRPLVRQAIIDGAIDTAGARHVCAALADVPADVDEARFEAVVVDGARQVLEEVCGGRAKPTDTDALARLGAAAVSATAAPASARLEPVFTFLAARIVPAVLGRTLRDLIEALLPGPSDEPGPDDDEDEYVELQQVLDGRWHLTGYLGPEAGTALNNELNRRMATDTVDDDSENADPLGRGRTAGQRRAAALASLARDGRDHDGTGADRAGADITILARAETLTGSPGALPARLGDGTRIPLDSLRRLGCFGRIAGVILDAAGQPVGASGTHRNATPRERRALEAQWGSCAVDGCRQPFTRTRPHHVIPWWLSKRTRLADLVPVCEHHHHDVHEGRRTLRLRDGRRIGPSGWHDGPGATVGNHVNRPDRR